MIAAMEAARHDETEPARQTGDPGSLSTQSGHSRPAPPDRAPLRSPWLGCMMLVASVGDSGMEGVP